MKLATKAIVLGSIAVVLQGAIVVLVSLQLGQIHNNLSEHVSTNQLAFQKDQARDALGSLQVLAAVAMSLAVIPTALLAFLVTSGISGRLRNVLEMTKKMDHRQHALPGEDEIALLERSVGRIVTSLEASQRKEKAFSSSLDAILTLERDGKIKTASPSCVQLWGYRIEDLVSKKFVSFIGPEDAATTRQHLATALSESSTVQFETSFKKADGMLSNLIMTATWSQEDQGFFVVARDITDRRITAMALEQGHKRIRSMFRSMPVGLTVLTDQGVIESVNPRFEQMFGYLADDVVGKTLYSFFEISKENEISFAQLVESQTVAHARPAEFDAAKHANGSQFPVEISITELSTPEEGTKLLASLQDITERREIERMKQEFVAMISHDLRTPLTSIQLCLSMATMGAYGEMSKQGFQCISIAERSCQRLITMINQLLDIEKLQAGMLELDVRMGPLDDVIQRSADAVRSFADESHVAIATQPVDCQVYADSDRLVQVMVNLLSNAIKYSPKEGTVSITTNVDADTVEIRITDQGRGIPPEYMSAIFERYKQVDKTDKREKKGTGLGLPICKAIVESHGGEIGVDCELGKGSTFWFRIPLNQPVSISTPTQTAVTS